MLPQDALEYYDSIFGTKKNLHPQRLAVTEIGGVVSFGKNPLHTEATTLQQGYIIGKNKRV